MLPVVDQSAHGVHHSWKLEQGTLKLPLKGNLPYDKEFTEAQTGLVRYVLEQPYSREVLCGMLGLQKQHKQRHAVLEEQLVELLVQAMERAELSGETAASAASAPLAAPAGASAAATPALTPPAAPAPPRRRRHLLRATATALSETKNQIDEPTISNSNRYSFKF